MTKHAVPVALAVLLLTTACGTQPRPRAVDPQRALAALRDVSVSLQVEEGDELTAVLASLSAQTGRPIRATPDVIALAQDAGSEFALEGVALPTVLGVLASWSNEPAVWLPEGRGAVLDLERNHPDIIRTQIFALGELTGGLTSGRPRLEPRVPDDVADEDNPLFDALEAGDEGGLAPTEVQALIGHVKRTVRPASVWAPPAEIRSRGRHVLIVRNTRAVLDRVAPVVHEWLAVRRARERR